MGSFPWARTSGRSRTAAGSVWGWAVSRLHLDWTARWMKEDEEMLVLTHQDQLNRTYEEDSRLAYDAQRLRASCRRDSLFLRAQDDLSVRERPAARPAPSTSTALPAFKDTTATLVATGPQTITTALAASPADSLRIQNPQSSDRGRKSADMQGEYIKSDTEENPREAHGPPRAQRASENGDEEPADQRRTRTNSPNPAQSHGLSTADGNSSPTITAWEAGWNVTNAIQGIFVLGLPHALVQSGYAGLILLVVSAWVCNHTGRILVACLYEEEHIRGSGSGSKVRVRHSYQDIVDACCKGLWSNWAGLGAGMVTVAQVIELLMTCTLYLVVSTSLLSDSLSESPVPRSVCSLVSLMFLLPCLLLTDLRPVSTLSLLCSLAHVLISLLVMLYCLSRASSWSWSSLSLSVNPENFLVSVGVIIFSYTSQIFLPPLEGSMEDRGQFDAMLGWTHGAACLMKTAFSLLAVLTWGAETSEVITDNLPSDLRPVVNLCLLAKALLSYPLPFYSAAEILQTSLFGDPAASPYSKHTGGGVPRAALPVRGALLVASYLLALLVPRFSLLMGLTGSVTGAAMTLVLPCLFHLRLRWGRLTAREQLVDVGILGLGVVCSVSGVLCSVRRLLQGL